MATDLEEAQRLFERADFDAALDELERARGTAYARAHIKELRDILSLSQSIRERVQGRSRDTADRVIYATTENLRFLERKPGASRLSLSEVVVIAGAAVLIICVLAVVGVVVLWNSVTTFPDHVGPSATLQEQADCLIQYSNSFKGYELDSYPQSGGDEGQAGRGDNTGTCIPPMKLAREKAFVACFNKYNVDHGHEHWPLANLKACQ